MESQFNQLRSVRPRLFWAVLVLAVASLLGAAGIWATRPGLAAVPTGTSGLAAGSAVHAASPNTVITPRYQNYPAPNGLGTSAGEPSIGVDWRTETNGNGGTVMLQSYLQTLRVTFDITCSTSLWEDKSAPTSVESLDPILFTDNRLGRTFVSQLIGQDSLSSFTDDDGNTYTPSQGGGIPSGPDHQSIGAGRYSTTLEPTHTYTDAVYYCSQGVAAALCSRSDNGGLTFGAGVPIYTTAQCNGLHGHVVVSPHDGTVFVPNNNCGFVGPLQYAGQAAIVSTNNGTTWSVNQIVDYNFPTDPNRTIRTGNSDPSIGIATGGRVYFGIQNTVTATDNLIDSPPFVATSEDNGLTWHDVQRVGGEYGIRNMVFPQMIAGDNDRAAFAFLGTPTGGDYQANTPPNVFTGIWHLYIARTFDGGITWSTVDVTPNDPVQRGSICTGGTTCGQDRNLLDFMGITVDSRGRVLVGYADGCIGGCVQAGPNSFSALGTIARQTGGSRLFAAYDPVEPTVPAGPEVTAVRASPTAPVVLHWTAPDNGGSPITSYNIYRGTSPGGETLLATVAGNTTTYTDTAVVGTTPYYYEVAAVNAVGTGPRSCEVQPVVAIVPNPCVLPGAQVIQDPTNDQLGQPSNPDLDIQGVYVAEPVQPDNVNRLVFTMKVADLSTVPANRQWVIIWNATAPGTGQSRNYVRMQSNAGGPSAVTFDYGVVVDYTRAPITQGSADATSGFTSDGAIRIVIPNSVVGNPQAGDTLANIQGLTFTGTGVINFRAEASVDNTGFGAYTLRGNAACASPPTNTPVPVNTNTPVPVNTNTPVPVNTNTPVPVGSGTPTNTSVPANTNTPVPANTNTPVPANTNTPVPLSSSTPCAASFSDVHPADYFYTPVLYLYCHGVISGYSDGTFRPYNNTTRAQMVKIVVLGFSKPITTPTGGAYTFTDVPPANNFWSVIETASADHIVSGYTCGAAPAGPCDAQHRPYFLPYSNVTRAQLAKIDAIAAGWSLYNPATPSFSDVPRGSTFYTVIETAHCHGVLDGYSDGTFRPYNNATRGQISKIVYLSIVNPPTSCGP